MKKFKSTFIVEETKV